MVQWFRLHASNAEVWVQSLVGELSVHMLPKCSQKLKIKGKKEDSFVW